MPCEKNQDYSPNGRKKITSNMLTIKLLYSFSQKNHRGVECWIGISGVPHLVHVPGKYDLVQKQSKLGNRGKWNPGLV